MKGKSWAVEGWFLWLDRGTCCKMCSVKEKLFQTLPCLLLAAAWAQCSLPCACPDVESRKSLPGRSTGRSIHRSHMPSPECTLQGDTMRMAPCRQTQLQHNRWRRRRKLLSRSCCDVYVSHLMLGACALSDSSHQQALSLQHFLTSKKPSRVAERAAAALQGYLTYTKAHPPGTLPRPMPTVLGGWVFSYERGTPVEEGTWRETRVGPACVDECPYY